MKHGMDTVAYLPHPSKPLTTFSVVKVTSQHTVDTARLEMEKIKMKWDNYSQASNREAVEFLMNSLDPRTEQMVLDNKQEEDDTFVVLWKVLQRGIMSISITRYAEIKDKIKALEPSQYPGHNILMMVIQLKEWCQELQDADQYDHYLTLIITKNFLKGGGATNELWRMPFLLLIPKLNDALLEIPHMSRETAWAHMKGEKLLWTHVCEQARNEYRMMLDNKEWPPQRSHRDSRRPHHRFGHPAITQDNQNHSQAQANALIQHTQASGQGSVTCHGCGKAGHFVKDCPMRTPPNPNKDQRKGQVAGEPVFVKNIQGKEHKWCGKCGRWTTTHSTGEHKPKPNGNGNRGNTNGRDTRGRFKPKHKGNKNNSSKKGRKDGNGRARANIALTPEPSAWAALWNEEEEFPDLEPLNLNPPRHQEKWHTAAMDMLTGVLAGMTLITLIMFLVGFLWCMIQAAKVEPLVPWVTLLGVLNLLLLNCFVGVELHSTPQCKVKICPTVTGKRMVTVLSTRDRLKRTISSHRHRRMVHDKKVFNHRMKKLVTPLTRRYGRRKPPKNGPYRRRWAPPVPPNHDPKPVNHNIQLHPGPEGRKLNTNVLQDHTGPGSPSML